MNRHQRRAKTAGVKSEGGERKIMRKAVSTHVQVRERLHPGILENLLKGGVEAIEIFAHRSHFDYADVRPVKELASWLRSREGVEFHALHAPIFASGEWGRFDSGPLNIAAHERKDRIEAMDEIKRAIAVAETAPFRYLILHPGVAGESTDEAQFEAALSSIEHLRAFAAPLGVRLLLENIPNELSEPVRLMEIIAALHYDDLGICLDMGHAQLYPGVEAAIQTMLAKIRSVHVHDNDGVKDQHLWPGEGKIDFARAVELLRAAPEPPVLVLEIKGHPEGDTAFGKVIVKQMKAAWRHLGA